MGNGVPAPYVLQNDELLHNGNATTRTEPSATPRNPARGAQSRQ